LAAILLFVYGWRSLKDLLERNTGKPETEDPDEVKAAKLIVAAIEGKRVAAPEGVEAAPQAATAGDSYVQRQRSALL
jgi:hypothetical protein